VLPAQATCPVQKSPPQCGASQPPDGIRASGLLACYHLRWLRSR